MNRRPKFKRLLILANIVLLFSCITIYLFDLLFGNGNGIIEKFNFNPLLTYLGGQLILLLFWGMSSKGQISNWSLSLFSLLILLIIIELAFRIIPSSVKSNIRVVNGPFPYKSYDPVFFKDNHPNCNFQYTHSPQDGGEKINIHINSQGIRGPEISTKDSLKERILFLGDSYIQAIQVPYKQTIGQLLQNDSTEIIQHGYPSYSPFLEFNWLLKKGIHFEPDRVFLFLYMNDFYSGSQVGDEGYTQFTEFDEQGYPKRFIFPDSQKEIRKNPFNQMLESFEKLKIFKWINFQLRLNNVVPDLPKTRFQSLLQANTPEFEKAYFAQDFKEDFLHSFRWDLIAGLRDTSLWDRAMRNRIQLSFDYLKKMNTFLKEKEIPLHLVFIPFPWQFPDESLYSKSQMGMEGIVFPYSGLQNMLQDFCEKEKISYLDLYESYKVFKMKHPHKKLYYNADRHWTPEGHALSAEIIKAKLMLNH